MDHSGCKNQAGRENIVLPRNGDGNLDDVGFIADIMFLPIAPDYMKSSELDGVESSLRKCFNNMTQNSVINSARHAENKSNISVGGNSKMVELSN